MNKTKFETASRFFLFTGSFYFGPVAGVVVFGVLIPFLLRGEESVSPFDLFF